MKPNIYISVIAVVVAVAACSSSVEQKEEKFSYAHVGSVDYRNLHTVEYLSEYATYIRGQASNGIKQIDVNGDREVLISILVDTTTSPIQSEFYLNFLSDGALPGEDIAQMVDQLFRQKLTSGSLYELATQHRYDGYQIYAVRDIQEAGPKLRASAARYLAICGFTDPSIVDILKSRMLLEDDLNAFYAQFYAVANNSVYIEYDTALFDNAVAQLGLDETRIDLLINYWSRQHVD